MTKHRVESGIALLILVFAFGVLCLTQVMTPDLYWQLRAGHDMAITHHAPTVDHLSWTRAGSPWISPEWLFYSLAWGLFQAGGLGAVWAGYAACVILLGILLWGMTLSVVRSPWLALLWVLTVGLSFRVWVSPRPFLASYLLFPVFLWIVHSVRKEPTRARLLWILVPLAAVGANLHQAVLAGIAVLVYYSIGDCIVAARSADPVLKRSQLQQSTHLLIVAGACLLATLLNPYGPHFLTDALATVQNPDLLSNVKEWLPLYRLPVSEVVSFYVYFALIVLIVALARKKPAWLDMLLLGILLFEAISHARHTALFEIGAAVLVAEAFGSAVERLFGTPSQRPDIERLRRFAVPALLVLVIAILVRGAATTLRQVGVETGPFLDRCARVAFETHVMPEGACRFLEQEPIPTTLRLYNSYTIGGFVSLKAPDHPVFIDGRTNLYFGPVLNAYSKGLTSPNAFYALLDKEGVDVAMVSEKVEQQALLASPDWVLVYQDYILIGGHPYFRALVFLRKRPELAALIAKCQRDYPH